MGKNIKVTPAEMTRTAGEIENLIGSYRNTYNNLCKQLKDLSVNWNGKDNRNFANKIEEFQPYFTKMENLLTEYKDFLIRSAQTYTETQDDIAGKAAALADSVR